MSQSLEDLQQHVENPEELERSIEEGKEEERQRERQQRSEATGAAAVEQWIGEETAKDTDIIEFHGKEFEFAEPGLIHYKKTMAYVVEINPEAFEDVNEDDDEEVKEAMAETVDEEGVMSMLGLFNHTLRTLAELCVDDPFDGAMGDMSDSEDEDEELPKGALRWGRFKEGDLTPLFRQVVVERYDGDEETEGN